MFGAGALAFEEFEMHEPLPLGTIHDAILDFLRGRDDAVISGAHAFNDYVDEPRMTQEVDILSTRGEELAQELKRLFNSRFSINVSIERGSPLFQLWEVRPHNDHRTQAASHRPRVDMRLLVDLYDLPRLLDANRIDDILVLAPDELLAWKVISYHNRRTSPKAGTDRRDIAMLLLKFPELKRAEGPVGDRLKEAALSSVWNEMVATDIRAEDEDSGF